MMMMTPLWGSFKCVRVANVNYSIHICTNPYAMLHRDKVILNSSANCSFEALGKIRAFDKESEILEAFEIFLHHTKMSHPITSLFRIDMADSFFPR